MYRSRASQRYSSRYLPNKRQPRASKHIITNRQSQSFCHKDTLCIFIMVISVLIYLLVMYLYFTQRFVIMAEQRTWPYLIQRDWQLPFSINTSEFEPPSNIRSSYIQWLQDPSTLCWNYDPNSQHSIFILGVLYEYSLQLKLFVRNNRMQYALMHNYVYCELSDDTKHSQDIIDNLEIHAIDPNTHYKRLWYKMYLIQHVMQQFKENIAYVLWVDADAVILNLNASLSEWYENSSSKHLFIGNDWVGLNSGVFILKDSNWTRNDLLKSIVSEKMMHLVKKDTTREQMAFWKYREQNTDKWQRFVCMVNNLQVWKYEILFMDGKNRKKLPLTFHWVKEFNLAKRAATIECSMILSQPLWLLNIAYGTSNKTTAYRDCKYNKL
eukprot:89315_1